MSSRPFAVEIRSDDVSRRLLCTWTLVAAIVGLVLIRKLNIDAGWRLLLALVWLADIAHGMARQRRGSRRLQALVLRADGALFAVDRFGERASIKLLTGSLVCGSLAWLRVQWPDGQHHGEFILARGVDPARWQRLRLLWRQRDGRFGAGRGTC